MAKDDVEAHLPLLVDKPAAGSQRAKFIALSIYFAINLSLSTFNKLILGKVSVSCSNAVAVADAFVSVVQFPMDSDCSSFNSHLDRKSRPAMARLLSRDKVGHERECGSRNLLNPIHH